VYIFVKTIFSVMGKVIFDQYGDISMPEFVELLTDKIYKSIEQLCDSAEQQANKLDKLEMHQSTSQYTTLCQNLIDDVRICIRDRKEKYIPYISSLAEKVATNHDCTGCTGSCRLNHDIQLIELKATHVSIKSVLYRLQMATLPLYTETIYPDAYRILRNQMALIENSLTELFFMEEKYLIPKVTEAQKIINAGSK